jgi:hypothetical protein
VKWKVRKKNMICLLGAEVGTEKGMREKEYIFGTSTTFSSWFAVSNMQCNVSHKSEKKEAYNLNTTGTLQCSTY